MRETEASRARAVRRPLLLAFGAWTLFVWATRIDNVLGEDGLSGAGRAARLALALSFVLVGGAAVAIWWRSRGRPLSAGAVRVVQAGAAWTVAVWVVRGIQIPLADHEAAFVVVHTVLALVSIGLAVAVVGGSTLRDRHGTTGHRHPEAHVA